MTICDNFKRFQYFYFETDFLEKENLFQKTGVSLLIETTKIENTSFQIALLEANIKTNKMATTKWTHHEEWSFAGNYLIFFENFSQFQNLFKRVNLMYQRRKCQFFVSIFSGV